MIVAGRTLRAIADEVSGRLIGDGDHVITGVRSLHDAEPEHLSMVSHPREARRLMATRAGALLVDEQTAAERAHELPCAVIACESPFLALRTVLRSMYAQPSRVAVVDERAAVDADAELGEAVAVGPFAVLGRCRVGARTRVGAQSVIEDDVEIGEDCTLAPGVVLMTGVRLGDRCIVHPGVVLGADGFGYAPDAERNLKVPQVGGLVLGDDVEVGANTCIDCGALSDTRIGDGTKIDNLVQVGHGVELGAHGVVIAQAGLAGGARVGEGVLWAGQSGCAQFVEVGDRARIGARGGVTRDMPAGAAWSGMPAYAHGDWLKTSVRLRDLDGMHRRLIAAEQRIAELEARLHPENPQSENPREEQDV